MLTKSKVGMMSGSMAPRTIKGRGAVLMKLGGRQRTFTGTAERSTDARVTLAPEPAVSSKATILVVEDDPGIRELASRLLLRYGFAVLTASGGDEAECGFRILCEASKYRTFVPAIPGESTNIALPLDKIRGVAAITPVFVAARDCTARDGTTLVRGALLGASADAIFVTVDEDWTGQIIPIDWLDFSQAQPPLPDEAFIHVELASSGEIVPRVWLNSKFRSDIETNPTPACEALPPLHWQSRYRTRLHLSP
jgi:hypothetical protein